MTISLSDAGKRFNREWIFRHFTYTFEEGRSYAITGPNGSGKSTLLQAISGSMHINEGSIKYELQNTKYETGSLHDGQENQKSKLPPEEIYNHVSLCAPYLEVVEEMTLKEFLNFHNGFKPFLQGITTNSIISSLALEKASNKQIRYYSSGMKQRVKLAQCIFSDTAIVLLDEPCTNLDIAGIELYQQLINDYCKNRLVVVSSNDEVEYKFCSEKINISSYK
ncbi:MAG: ATP-binding cassette domain-containing protein [Bacteroidota bacterium]|nr:ATP-binding cassette domain-containing protein [Bacteroidota bacterium]